MTENVPEISIIIPVYNAKNYLVQSLPAFTNVQQQNFELIVVDDSSSDGSLELAQRYADVVLKTEKNSGPAQARNRGARTSKGPILLFLDADVRIYPDTIAKILSSFQKNPETSALFGSYDSVPPEKNFFSQYKNLHHHYVHQKASTDARTFWAGCGAVRRADFDEVGGFSSEFAKPSIEDVELGYKFIERGKTIKLLKELQVTHLKKWTFFGLLKADILYRAIPWTLLARKKGLPRDLNFKLSDRVSGAAASLLLLSLCFIWKWPILGFFVLFLAALLLLLHRDLYIFFIRKKGLAFTLFAVLYHWFYYFYSTFTFVIFTTVYMIKDAFKKKSKLTETKTDN
ncbi:MAG: glycosyltransferase family A protein [Candidatus Aminicenantes bacterium]|jgi:glycosyltransferase involved in cell wall biosynthesis